MRKAEVSGFLHEQKEVRRICSSSDLRHIHRFAVKIYNKYGDQTISIIKENPYRLAQDIVGIGFKTADRIARNMGVLFDSPYRVMAGTRYVLSRAANNGHTYLPRKELTEKAAKLLGVDPQLVDNAIVSLVMDGDIILEERSDHTAVYLQPLRGGEQHLQKAYRTFHD